MPPINQVSVGKEGQQGAGASLVIAKVKVVDVGVVEVHGLLYQPQSKYPIVKVKILLRVTGNGRNVVNSGDELVHIQAFKSE